MEKTDKIVVVGSGNVGAHCGLFLLLTNTAGKVIYIDIDREKAEGQIMDMEDAAVFSGGGSLVEFGDYDDCRDADIVVVTAGRGRKPGETRADLLTESLKIMAPIAEGIKNSGFSGILIVISNPADVMTDFFAKRTGFPKNRVFSTGSMLDAARMRKIIADMAGTDIENVDALVMGEHGETQVPVFSNTTVDGVPFDEFCKNKSGVSKEEVVEKLRLRGADIIKRKGRTEFGIGMSLCDLAGAVLRNEKRVIPVSAYLSGQYGQRGLYAGVPCIVGREGIEAIVEYKLSDEETSLFAKSCDEIRKYISIADRC